MTNQSAATVQGPLTLRLSFWLRLVLWAMVAMGFAVFLFEVLSGGRQRSWQTFHVNFVFWTGLAQAGVVFAAAYRITNGRWGEFMRRLGMAMASFLPVSILLFVVLMLGRSYIFPWVHTDPSRVLEPVPAKQAWLDAPALFTRDGLALLLLGALSYAFVYYSMRPAWGLLVLPTGNLWSRFMKLGQQGWKGLEAEHVRCQGILDRLTPILLIAYALVYSLVGFDLLMSLEPHWYSTLFGWDYFLTTFYSAIAAITVLAVLVRRYCHLESRIAVAEFYDMGRLLLGFCLLCGGFFLAQYLVVWYGNITEEIEWMIRRFHHQPWAVVGWTCVAGLFLIPLTAFLSRELKRRPLLLMSVAGLILVMMWLWRYLAIVPALWKEHSLPLGVPELLITTGFSAAWTLVLFSYLSVAPIILPPEAEKLGLPPVVH